MKSFPQRLGAEQSWIVPESWKHHIPGMLSVKAFSVEPPPSQVTNTYPANRRSSLKRIIQFCYNSSKNYYVGLL